MDATTLIGSLTNGQLIAGAIVLISFYLGIIASS